MDIAKHSMDFSSFKRRALQWESYQKFCHPAFLLYGFSAALSIALSQIILVSVIVYWIVLQCSRGSSLSKQQDGLRRSLSLYGIPVLIWIILAAFSCIVGLDPARSFVELYKTALYMLLPFAVASALLPLSLSDEEVLHRIFLYGRNFLIGSSIASIHTILSTARGVELPIGVPGGLTEAGQLVLFIPLALFAVFEMKAVTQLSKLHYAVFALFSICLLLFAWPQVGALVFSDSQFFIVQCITGLVVLLIASYSAWQLKTDSHPTPSAALLRITLVVTAFLFAALLFNLKRGPWAAVIVELCLIGLFFSRRLLFASIGSSLLLLFTVEPIRARVSSLLDHFLIHGGRSSMWSLGVEMSGRFPLGVGLDNARYMRKLDPTMPETHLHMHNNFINVAVETGFLGLAVYLWWNILMITLGVKLWNYSRTLEQPVKRQAGRLAAFFAMTLLAWQVSGLVEYNFGDGEIRLVVLFVMGVLLALSRFFSTEVARQSE